MNGEIFYYHTLHPEKMSPTNEQNNNESIKTAVDIFSEILVQMIDDVRMGNADASSKVNINNLTKNKNDKTST